MDVCNCTGYWKCDSAKFAACSKITSGLLSLCLTQVDQTVLELLSVISPVFLLSND